MLKDFPNIRKPNYFIFNNLLLYAYIFIKARFSENLL